MKRRLFLEDSLDRDDQPHRSPRAFKTYTRRLRVTTNNSLTIELRNNFHLAFIVWDNFDSRPPVTARKNELATSTGIGRSS
jgi:hypothetical protein